MATKVKETKENINRRAQSFRERMRANGFVRVFGWVPAQYKEKVMDFIKSFRSGKEGE